MKEGEEFVTVATFANSMQASLAKGALEAAGIPALAPGEDFGAFALTSSLPQQTWAELKVRSSDRERALEVLKDAGHR
jgi:putative signal transducing protein